MKKVLVSGCFDPIHDGHIDHIEKAARLGDYLYVITHPRDTIRSCKKVAWTNDRTRLLLLNGLLKELHIRGECRLSHRGDWGIGKTLKTLEAIRPDIYAKGGDRTPENMAPEEVELCRKLGIKIVYGIGQRLNSSSQIKAAQR